uniref:Uncharacterized protein n=1 Tax=Arundo donax TaxID=35708 RepID=A0A0A8Z9S3_ARUDO
MKIPEKLLLFGQPFGTSFEK